MIMAASVSFMTLLFGWCCVKVMQPAEVKCEVPVEDERHE